MKELEIKTLYRFDKLLSIIKGKISEQYVSCDVKNSVHYCEIFFLPKELEHKIFIRLECILDSQIDQTPHNYKYGITYGLCQDKNSKVIYRGSDTDKIMQNLFLECMNLSNDALNKDEMSPSWLFWFRLDSNYDLNEFVDNLIVLRDRIIQEFGNNICLLCV